MKSKHHTKLVHERDYVAEVEVELIYSDDGWSPYLSVEDAYKLDDVREALREGNLKAASRLAKVYILTPAYRISFPVWSCRSIERVTPP